MSLEDFAPVIVAAPDKEAGEDGEDYGDIGAGDEEECPGEVEGDSGNDYDDDEKGDCGAGKDVDRLVLHSWTSDEHLWWPPSSGS